MFGVGIGISSQNLFSNRGWRGRGGAAWRHFTGAKDIAILHRGSELVLFEALKITMDWSMGTGSLVSTAFILKTLLFGY